MSDLENHAASSREKEPGDERQPLGQGSEKGGGDCTKQSPGNGDSDVTGAGPQLPERVPLPGPEIPNADVDERGVFRFPKGEFEVFESARIEFPIEPLCEEETPIEWLWPERIALGLVTFLEEASSAGKSFVVLDMAARVTRGAPWPGRVEGPQRAGDVLLVCGDSDGWERALLPRLTQAGADLSRVGCSGVVESCDPGVKNPKKVYTLRRLNFPDDLVMLEYNIRVRPATRLVVIDPLSAFCANDRACRETLRQLDEIAARRNVAIVVTARPTGARARRPTESDRRADTVRAVFRVLVDSEDETLHHLAPVRMSFCALPEWLPFRIASDVAGRGVIRWGPPAEVPPESAVPPNPASERGALRRTVKEWLRTMLLKSDMLLVRVHREAKKCGFSQATLRRAREDLGVRMYRDDMGPLSNGWWTLRPKEPSDADPDGVPLSGIQSWEGRLLGGDALPGEVQETHRQPGKADVPTRGQPGKADVPGANRMRKGRKSKAPSPAPQASEEEDELPPADAAWEKEVEPFLEMIIRKGMGNRKEEDLPARHLPATPGRPPLNGHTSSNGKHGSNGQHDPNGGPPHPQ